MSRLLLSPAVIAMLLVSIFPALANDAIASKPPSSNFKKDRLVVTPTNLGFGKVKVGRRRLQTMTVTNLGTSDIRLLQVVTRGRDFDVTGLDLPVTLAGGERYTFSAVFTPRSRGASSGSVAFVSDASGASIPTLTLELTGMGEDNDEVLDINPPTMNFGAVQLGSSASQTGSLTAAADQVTISSALSSSSEFTLSGLSFPVTIPPGGSQGFMVTFAPQTSGPTSAAISFVDANGIPLAVEPLNGTGVSPQDHSVSLSWNASTSQNVVGYNVYRSDQSGGPYTKINPVLDSTTSYTDTSVVDGDTYYYVTTAVNSDNEESGYSNQAQATIPCSSPGCTVFGSQAPRVF
jgi:Abnormal spindle-like microcephaly-assoc'd, ASPM-SPD-2-Hydin/Transmembrane protein 131-like N-terminal